MSAPPPPGARPRAKAYKGRWRILKVPTCSADAFPYVRAHFPTRALLLALSAVAGLSTAAGPAGAIVNGTAAPDGAYPWTVAIVAKGVPAVQGQFCGGTLIAPTRVLTAAHCIDPGGPNEATVDSLDVLVGQTSLRATGCVNVCGDGGSTDFTVGARLGVSQISLHGQADVANLRYDVAILTLSEPVPTQLQAAIVAPVVPTGESVAPATDEDLGVDPNSPQATGWGVGTNATVFGWGKRNLPGTSGGSTSTGSWDYPDVLHRVAKTDADAPGLGSTLERLPDTYCAGRYPGQFQPSDMLCAGPDTSLTTKAPDSCNGDSGGPLLRMSKLPSLDGPNPPVDPALSLQRDPANWRLMGVVSWGPSGRCGDPNLPGVYTRVGAPAIHSYITNAAPAPMPTLTSTAQAPVITGGYGPGSQITCHPGSWQHATSFTFVMWRDLDGNRLRSGSNETLLTGSDDGLYDVTSTDIAGRTSGDQIGCIVTARGPGGYATAQASSQLNLAVQQPPAPPPPPSGGTPPTIAPTTPAPTPVDKLAPRLIKDFVVCGVSSCKVSIFATDTGLAASGVRRLAASLVVTRRVKCRKVKGKRSCTKTTTRSVKLRRNDEIYSATIKKLRRNDKHKLRVRAYDEAGNVSTLTLTLKVRVKKPSR